MTNRLVGTIDGITAERSGIQEITVRVIARDGVVGSNSMSISRPAMNLTGITGTVEIGDEVEINTSAVDLNLGTGGFDFVIAVLNRTPETADPPGHIIKLRYTPLQMPVLAVSSPESPFHDAVKNFESLREMPVVCFELHSQLPAICAALQWALKDCGIEGKIVYIMTDGAALPMAISRLVPRLLARNMISATITAGQAFGGQYEAVNMYSAMSAACDGLKADAIIIGQGPGNVGTHTRLGFSGIDQGLAVNAAASLGGSPIFVPRVSFGDSRERHIGLSHHSITNLQLIARAPAYVTIPRLPANQQEKLAKSLEENGISDQHDVVTVDAERGLAALEDAGIAVTTMGRGVNAERAFFLAAAAAGMLAAQMIETKRKLIK